MSLKIPKLFMKTNISIQKDCVFTAKKSNIRKHKHTQREGGCYFNPGHAISKESTGFLDMGNVICIAEAATTAKEVKLE